jgi:hypothetical protein
MEQIKIENIEAAVKKIDAMDEAALERYSETLVLSQETFVGYVLSSSIEFNNDDLVNHLMYYFNIFHESFAQQGLQLSTVTEEIIAEFETSYFDVLDEYQESEDFDVILSFTNQPGLMEFMLGEINYDLDEGNIDDDMMDQIFLVGTAIIGLMTKVSTKA